MIIVRIWEDLGNQMFQYAYAWALQAKGMEVRLDMGKAYDELFYKYRNHIQRTTAIQNFNLWVKTIDVYKYGRYSYLNQDTPVRKMLYSLGKNSMWLYNFYEEEEQKYSRKAEKIKGNYYIKGWFQSERYFKDISILTCLNGLLTVSKGWHSPFFAYQWTWALLSSKSGNKTRPTAA